MTGTVARGAYGFAIEGVDSRLLGSAGGPEAPRLTVERGAIDGDPGRTVYERDRASIRLVDGGRAELIREERRARFLTRRPLDDDDLAHPYLAAAASVFAGWQGWEAFHAAAYAVGDRAVAVFGGKELGKSTLAATLAVGGAPILTDDVLVVAGSVALPGPRCVDLRPPAAAVLGERAALERVRGGERFRLVLSPTPPARLAGLVFLAWGAETSLEPLRPGERLGRLAAHHAARASTRPGAILDLARLPAWELRRPFDWEALGQTVRLLGELAA